MKGVCVCVRVCSCVHWEPDSLGPAVKLTGGYLVTTGESNAQIHLPHPVPMLLMQCKGYPN